MGKRGNGEGGISRRKDGLYMARYTVQTPTGPKRKALARSGDAVYGGELSAQVDPVT
jgi:hypothetical protein